MRRALPREWGAEVEAMTPRQLKIAAQATVDRVSAPPVTEEELAALEREVEFLNSAEGCG